MKTPDYSLIKSSCMQLNIPYAHGASFVAKCAELKLHCRVLTGIEHPSGFITHEVFEYPKNDDDRYDQGSMDGAPWVELGKYLRMVSTSDCIDVVSFSGRGYSVTFGYTDFNQEYLTMFVFDDETGELIEYNGNGIKEKIVAMIDQTEKELFTNKKTI